MTPKMVTGLNYANEEGLIEIKIVEQKKKVNGAPKHVILYETELANVKTDGYKLGFLWNGQPLAHFFREKSKKSNARNINEHPLVK
nr:hypothetical protein [Tanacetum cinerariifolium]